MNWFYKLQRKYRIIITVVAWLPVLIVSGLIYNSLGGKTDNINAWQSIIVLLLLVLGVVFTVFAILARRHDKNIKKEKITADDVKNQGKTTNNNANARFILKNADGSVDVTYYNGNKKHYIANEAKDIVFESTNDEWDTDNDSNVDIEDNFKTKIGFESGVDLPLFTKVVGVTFNDCQENIKTSKIGDELIIKHTPSEKYPESTAVINKRTNKMLGHIRKDIAISLVKEFKNNFVLVGEIADITGGNVGESYGCNIKIKED